MLGGLSSRALPDVQRRTLDELTEDLDLTYGDTRSKQSAFWTMLILSAIIATRWFIRHRGLVTGLLTAAFATGNLIFLPLLAWITTTMGWRTAAVLVAALAALTIPVVLTFMRNHPADADVPPYGGDVVVPAPPRPSGSPFAEPLRVLSAASRIPAARVSPAAATSAAKASSHAPLRRR